MLPGSPNPSTPRTSNAKARSSLANAAFRAPCFAWRRWSSTLITVLSRSKGEGVPPADTGSKSCLLGEAEEGKISLSKSPSKCPRPPQKSLGMCNFSASSPMVKLEIAPLPQSHGLHASTRISVVHGASQRSCTCCCQIRTPLAATRKPFLTRIVYFNSS